MVVCLYLWPRIGLPISGIFWNWLQSPHHPEKDYTVEDKLKSLQSLRLVTQCCVNQQTRQPLCVCTLLVLNTKILLLLIIYLFSVELSVQQTLKVCNLHIFYFRHRASSLSLTLWPCLQCPPVQLYVSDCMKAFLHGHIFVFSEGIWSAKILKSPPKHVGISFS